MGGRVSKAISKKVLRPFQNIHFEERAHKAVDKHKVKPVAAPRHESTKKIIEKHIGGPERSSIEHPEIKEELVKHDENLIHRVNRLQLDQISEMPKILAKDRPLPQSREVITDPLRALEEPKHIPKGKISFQQLGVILEKCRNEPSQYQAEVIAKEYGLDLQDTVHLMKYFEKIKLEDIIDLEEMKRQQEKLNVRFKMDIDYGVKKQKPS